LQGPLTAVSTARAAAHARSSCSSAHDSRRSASSASAAAGTEEGSDNQPSSSSDDGDDDDDDDDDDGLLDFLSSASGMAWAADIVTEWDKTRKAMDAMDLSSFFR
jgi:hypothetical protein